MTHRFQLPQFDFEKIRNLAIMILVAIILFFCATGCKVAQVASSDTVRETIYRERVRDTTIIVPADSSAITALIECRDGQARLVEILNYRPGNVAQPPKVVIRDNWLTAKCIVDSLAVYVRLKERDTTIVTSSSTVVVPPPVNFVTSWQWAQIWAGRLFLALAVIYLVVLILRRYTGWKL